MFEFKKEISVTARDYAGFNKDYRYTSRKVTFILVWVLTLLITLLFYTAVDRDSLKYTSTPFMIFLFVFMYAIISAAVWAVYFLFRWIGSAFDRWSYTRNVKFKQAELTLNSTGIKIENQKNSFFATWYQIAKVSESPDAFYLYHTARAAFILPKRYIGSGLEISQLRDFVAEMQKQTIASNYN